MSADQVLRVKSGSTWHLAVSKEAIRPHSMPVTEVLPDLWWCLVVSLDAMVAARNVAPLNGTGCVPAEPPLIPLHCINSFPGDEVDNGIMDLAL